MKRKGVPLPTERKKRSSYDQQKAKSIGKTDFEKINKNISQKVWKVKKEIVPLQPLRKTVAIEL